MVSCAVRFDTRYYTGSDGVPITFYYGSGSATTPVRIIKSVEDAFRRLNRLEIMSKEVTQSCSEELVKPIEVVVLSTDKRSEEQITETVFYLRLSIKGII